MFYPLGLKENFYKIVSPCAILYILKDYIVKKYVQKINIIDLKKKMHEVTKNDTIKNINIQEKLAIILLDDKMRE